MGTLLLAEHIYNFCHFSLLLLENVKKKISEPNWSGEANDLPEVNKEIGIILLNLHTFKLNK